MSTDFLPGAVVIATFDFNHRWPTYKFGPDGSCLLTGATEVAAGQIGVVVYIQTTQHYPDEHIKALGTWIHMLKTKRTIRSKEPWRYFAVKHLPREDVRAAVEACVMADEIAAAAKIAYDDLWEEA